MSRSFCTTRSGSQRNGHSAEQALGGKLGSDLLDAAHVLLVRDALAWRQPPGRLALRQAALPGLADRLAAVVHAVVVHVYQEAAAVDRLHAAAVVSREAR